MNILIVEDDRIAATFLSDTLKDFFNSTHVCYNGNEALAILQTKAIDLLITDLSMPFCSGVKLIQVIRDTEYMHTKSPLPIIVISGRKEANDLLEMFKYELIDYIMKPFSLSQLFATLERLSLKIKMAGVQFYSIDKNLIYDSFKKNLIKDEEEITLTASEALLLQILLENKGRLISRATLIEKIYDYDVKDVSFRNLVMRLRKKLGKDYIINLKDLGMRIE